MKIIKPGTEVTTKIESIRAIVTGVTIRFNAIQYELGYFHNGEYKTAWLNEAEFTYTSARVQIGFKVKD